MDQIKAKHKSISLKKEDIKTETKLESNEIDMIDV